MALARRTEVAVTYGGVNITDDISPSLIDLSLTDNLSGAVDSLSLSLHDRDGKWAGDWRPTYGDVIDVDITTEPWLSQVRTLRLKNFSHDKISFSGPPKRVTIEAVSVPLSSRVRRQRKTRTWASVSLKTIAKDIADRAGLDLLYFPDEGAKYRRREQKDESDLAFLQAACEESGLGLKLADGKIAIFDEYELEQATPAHVISLLLGDVLNWSFEGQEHEKYGRCRVKFYDPRKGKIIEAEYKDRSNDGPTLEVTRAVSSIGEAERLAKAMLRNANRFGTTGTLNCVGDPALVSGSVIQLTDAYGFDGNYIITKVDGKVGGGFTDSLTLRRVLEF